MNTLIKVKDSIYKDVYYISLDLRFAEQAARVFQYSVIKHILKRKGIVKMYKCCENVCLDKSEVKIFLTNKMYDMIYGIVLKQTIYCARNIKIDGHFWTMDTLKKGVLILIQNELRYQLMRRYGLLDCDIEEGFLKELYETYINTMVDNMKNHIAPDKRVRRRLDRHNVIVYDTHCGLQV